MPGNRAIVTRLRALLIAIVAAAAAMVAHAADGPRVEIVQAGQVVPTVDGIHVLARAPFVVKAAGGFGALSLFTTTAPGAAVAAGELRGRPLLAPIGTGMAVVPLSIHVENARLEHYAGLSSQLLEQWGSVLGPELVGAYGTVRASLAAEPSVLLSGRQYSTVVRRADDAQLLPVFAIGDAPVADTPVTDLALAVFFDVVPTVGTSPWTRLDGPDVLLLRFAGRDGTARRKVTSGTPLDCGKSGVVRTLHDPHWQRLERLLRDGLDPNLKSPKGGYTLLMCAISGTGVQPGAIAALLDAGAAVDARATTGETALHWAVRGAGERDAARLIGLDHLLRRGAGPNIRDAGGETPLLAAVSADYPEAVALLLSHGADPAVRDVHGETALVRARRLARSEVAWLLQLATETSSAP